MSVNASNGEKVDIIIEVSGGVVVAVYTNLPEEKINLQLQDWDNREAECDKNYNSEREQLEFEDEVQFMTQICP